MTNCYRDVSFKPRGTQQVTRWWFGPGSDISELQTLEDRLSNTLVGSVSNSVQKWVRNDHIQCRCEPFLKLMSTNVEWIGSLTTSPDDASKFEGGWPWPRHVWPRLGSPANGGRQLEGLCGVTAMKSSQGREVAHWEEWLSRESIILTDIQLISPVTLLFGRRII